MAALARLLRHRVGDVVSAPLIPLEAEQSILARVLPMAAEMVPLALCPGRVLRQDVVAERENPPFDRVCMDGVAVASSAYRDGVRSFVLQAAQAAGVPPLELAAPAGAIEVMTGAVLPGGTDAVIPLEEYSVTAGRVTLHAQAGADPGRNVQRRGSDCRKGVPMLTAGMLLGPTEIAVVASAGLAQAAVSCLPSIMVVSTGDELIEPGQPITDHQVRRSNAYGVAAALQLAGFACDSTHLHDDEISMYCRLGGILASKQVLIVSGGVSKGRFDYVPRVLKALGVEQVFQGVAQRPGQPLWFGIGPQGQLVFGLPGNPVATLVCMARYVLPALRKAILLRQAPQQRLALAEAAEGRKLTCFIPVVLLPEAATPTMASARAIRGSGDFLSLAGTHGFVELPPRPVGYPQGFVANFYHW